MSPKSPIAVAIERLYPSGIPPDQINHVVELIHHYEAATYSPTPAVVVPRRVAPPPLAKTHASPPAAARRGRPPGAKSQKPKPPPRQPRGAGLPEEMLERARGLLLEEPRLIANLEEELGPTARGRGFEIVTLLGAEKAGVFEDDEKGQFPLFALSR